ncbi:hypothetical protein JR334_10945 [Clostridia bacterium]|nr:hypothetical protein JR334_10945 [Clostridia bacterium]
MIYVYECLVGQNIGSQVADGTTHISQGSTRLQDGLGDLEGTFS